MNSLQRHIILLSLAMLLLLPPCCMAEGTSPTLPATFVRITSMDDITDDGYYLIGGYGVKEHFWLMKGDASSKKENYLAAWKPDVFSDILNIGTEQEKYVWQILKRDDAYVLSNGSGYIYNKLDKKKNATNYLVIESKEFTKWDILFEEDGTARIHNASSSEYYLGFNDYDDYCYFGNYKKTGSAEITLYIYKLATDFSQIPGIAESPANGERITITTGNILPTPEFTGQSPDNFLLHNGDIAPDDGLASFTVTTAADGAFLLKDADGLYLQYSLNTSGNETKWQIYNGHIATFEKTPRYILFDEVENRFGVYSSNDAIKIFSTNSYVYFQPIGAEPTSSNATGLLTLSGAWSKERLAKIGFENVAAIDLSGISLPTKCEAFSNYPAEANIPIYVAEEYAEIIPETWNFAVAGNNLLRATTLYDKKTLYVPREIKFEDNQITYKRNTLGGGGWETLCLPFDAELPKDYIIESLKEITGNNLIFEETNQISRDIPLIFAKRTGTEPCELLVMAKAGSLNEYVNSGSEGFHGVYKRLDVESADENFYFLNEDGTTFVRAAEGSGLSPFRAYIRLNRTSNAPLYINFRATGISMPRTSTGKETFTIDGRRADIHKAGKGLYIADGKKIFVSNP